MIELINISKKYGEKVAVSDFSYKFTNKLYQITGKNGAGKSVLLRIIAGIEKPDSGRVSSSIDGSRILFLTDNGIGLPFLSIIDNIFLSAKLLDIHIEKSDFFTLFANDEVLLNSEYKSSSLGNQMKVGLALLFADAKFDLIIIDEALNGVDRQSEKMILNKVKSLSDNTPVILVSHNTLIEKESGTVTIVDI
ncbi:ATP-binding cassette domain-containing protein [Weissella minor]|uniref:ATP-binding cassette domain-containing protein n=1 Tax=Weissella minor TaxID=1620 RepID=UPI003AF2FD2A